MGLAEHRRWPLGRSWLGRFPVIFAPADSVAKAGPHVTEARTNLAEPVGNHRLRCGFRLVDHGRRRVAEQPHGPRQPPRVELHPQLEMIATAERNVQEVRSHPLAGGHPQPERVLVALVLSLIHISEPTRLGMISY